MSHIQRSILETTKFLIDQYVSTSSPLPPWQGRGEENLFKEQRLLGIRDLVERCIQRTGWANFCGKLDQTNSSEREKLKTANSQMSSDKKDPGWQWLVSKLSVLICIYAYTAISGYCDTSESVTSKLCSFGVESGSRKNTEMIFYVVET